MDRLGDRIEDDGILLDGDVVLNRRFVQYAPVIDFEVIAGLMIFPYLVGEAALRVPGENACLEIGELFACGILQ
jgi:hypothetical protein